MEEHEVKFPEFFAPCTSGRIDASEPLAATPGGDG